MQIFLTQAPQTGKVNEFVEYNFDGRYLQATLNGKMVISQPAMLGQAFYIIPQGQKNAPLVTKAEIPTNRGGKIAWALSFIGADKCMPSENAFYETYDKLVKEDSIMNIASFISYGKYAIVIADKYKHNDNPEKCKVKKNNPVLAWISDDIPLWALNELLDKYESRRRLPCPKEFFYIL